MMLELVATDMPAEEVGAERVFGKASSPARIEELLTEHHRFVWRLLRRLGVAQHHVDDAVQSVFIVAAEKLSHIEMGKERSFLVGTAMRVAANARRTRLRKLEDAHEPLTNEQIDMKPAPDELLEWKRRRELLDDALDALDVDLRSVFVLFELEDLSTTEVSELLDIPPGTVASRLRRARARFYERVGLLRNRPLSGEP